MGVDKGELYIYVYSFILSVFVLFSIILWVFTCDFYLVGDTWAKDQRGDEKGPNELKLDNANEHVATWLFHAATWPCLTQKPESNMPRHAMSIWLLTFSLYRSMTKSCHGMAVLICKTWFLLFLESRFYDSYYNTTPLSL